MTDVFERYLQAVDRGPGRPAVCDHDRTLSYEELDRYVARLANAFAHHGEHPRVLILLDQGWRAYAAKFGTIMAGGTYAPVNTQAPANRIAMIADQFRADVIVTQQRVRDRVPDLKLAAPLLDIEGDLPPPLAQARPAAKLIYVMFTSGSTGVPKGVMIGRGAINHYVDWVFDAFRPTPDDRWSQHPNIAFDLSQLDIYGCLCSGGALYPLNSRHDRLMPARAIQRNRLTLWSSVPSIINMMTQADQATAENLASMRLMNFIGEPLLYEHLEALFAARPDLTVWNTYGPTEATVSCTLRPLTARDSRTACRGSVSIGKAIPGMRLELMGGPSADEGEIVIFGPQLAEGYWDNPEQTKKAFRSVALPEGTMRGYFTGDWARREQDEMYFVGRMDNQVKIHGIRTELGEIEQALRRCGFTDAVVVMLDREVHGFIETADNAIDESALRARLAQVLMPQAIPKMFHLMPAFPRNDNDKIDRGALLKQVPGLV
ncbi:MAG: amino acid adenylation domain-containing protein [Xanthobacteraceae bacterium]|jgi:D-alanine--poly(phosphoribitol) ligase subunit 1